LQSQEMRSSATAGHAAIRDGQRSDPAGDDYFQAAKAGLAMLPDAIDPDLPRLLLARHYGLSGFVETLSSEVERTYEVNVDGAARLILKTSARPQAFESFRFQSATLAGLDGAAGVIAPKVIGTHSGALMFEDGATGGYLQTKIDGLALHKVPGTPHTLHDVGMALARLHLALAGIDAPAARRPVLWNIACWPRLNELEHYLPEGPTAARVRAAMAGYRLTVEPRIAELDWQITHNDPSPFNMILTGDGLAFIDLGDGGWNPRLQDLAIAAGHFVTDSAIPLGGSEYVIAGYASLIRLSDVETRLLVGMMQARQGAMILINTWRARLFPADARYITKNVGRAERGLAILSGLDATAGEAAVRSAMALDRP
jgi:hydroxylysine kinase